MKGFPHIYLGFLNPWHNDLKYIKFFALYWGSESWTGKFINVVILNFEIELRW